MGIHYFDLLIYLFGGYDDVEVFYLKRKEGKGLIKGKNYLCEWHFSLNANKEKQERIFQIDNKKIKVVFSLPKTFIDQQAGCDLKCLTERFEKAFEVWKEDKPALLIPTGDGENGNVMMNEFFPQTFLPFFKRGYPKVSSYLISEFLEKFYKKIDQKIEISSVGGSWIDHHEQWLVGSKRLEIIKEIEKISSIYHSLKNKSEELKKLLLIAETSCYVYWNIDYWFNQGKKAIQKFLSLIKKLNI